MKWNWEQKNWPHFEYDPTALAELEQRFLMESGILQGTLKHIAGDEKKMLTVELMSEEALKTSEIEGEFLNQDSLQSSIRRQFGLQTDNRKVPLAEQGIAEMTVGIYETWTESLSNQTLFKWHAMLTQGRTDLSEKGSYRASSEPMQVISGPVSRRKVHFEAPPSDCVLQEMNTFIDWFNNSAPTGKQPLPALTRAGISHLYFVSIHPFEDGNGRVGRALSEKALSQSQKQPSLIALARTIEAKRKSYYASLERVNRRIEITDWLIYFSETILAAQTYTLECIEFLIEKARFYDRLGTKLNQRQHKVLARMFQEGLDGFKGGLSADNYIKIAKTSASTTTRDLQDLVTKGALSRTGERKHTRYHLPIKVHQHPNEQGL